MDVFDATGKVNQAIYWQMKDLERELPSVAIGAHFYRPRNFSEGLISELELQHYRGSEAKNALDASQPLKKGAHEIK